MDKEKNDAQNLETSENIPSTYKKRSGNISMEEPTRKDIIMMLGRIQESVDELRSDTNERMDKLDAKVGNLGANVGNLGARVGNLETNVGNLGANVGNLGARVGNLETNVGNLGANVGNLETKMDSLGANVGNLETKMDSLETNVGNLGARVGNLETKMGNLETKMGKMQTDVSNLKGRAVCDATRSSAKTIAERTVNAKFVRILDRSKIHSMADKAKNKDKLSGISDASLQSFRGADTVIEVMLEGCLHYIAVESSYVGDGNDARRAARNAEYITRFTGTKATPVVACVTCNYDKTEYGVEPYHITDRSLAPE